MKAIAKFFLNCTPHSILVRKDEAWLIVRSRAGREWFLPPPTPVGHVDRALNRFGVCKNRFLQAFFCEFAGFREELPDVAGFFFRVEDWSSFKVYVDRLGWEVSKIPRVWSRAPVVFESLCGDALFLDCEASLVWWDHELDQFRVLYRDFKKLPSHWLKSIRQNYPFDR
jgi:hypothetical protein